LGPQASAQGSLRALNISIGHMPLSILIPGANLRQRALARYQEFAGESADGLPVVLRNGAPNHARLARNDPNFSYILDEASMLLDSSGAEFHGVRHEYALDSLLRILLTMVLLPQRGFLLHAATVVRDGRAYVFTGRSGAGKSTVAAAGKHMERRSGENSERPGRTNITRSRGSTHSFNLLKTAWRA
jgi:hypothetical protein